MPKYTVEFPPGNTVARTLIDALGNAGAEVTRGVSEGEYPLFYCTHCKQPVRIMRKCEDLKMLVPVFEQDVGLAGLDFTEWESDPEVGDTDPQYVCEECGALLFDKLEDIDTWLKERKKHE